MWRRNRSPQRCSLKPYRQNPHWSERSTMFRRATTRLHVLSWLPRTPCRAPLPSIDLASAEKPTSACAHNDIVPDMSSWTILGKHTTPCLGAAAPCLISMYSYIRQPVQRRRMVWRKHGDCHPGAGFDPLFDGENVGVNCAPDTLYNTTCHGSQASGRVSFYSSTLRSASPLPPGDPI